MFTVKFSKRFIYAFTGIVLVGIVSIYIIAYIKMDNYQRMHDLLESRLISKIEFKFLEQVVFEISEPHRIDGFLSKFQKLRLSSNLGWGRTGCRITVFQKDGGTIKYNLYFNATKRLISASIQGTANWNIGGISMGMYRGTDDLLFDWLTESGRYQPYIYKQRLC
jgi:hypothetical protein